VNFRALFEHATLVTASRALSGNVAFASGRRLQPALFIPSIRMLWFFGGGVLASADVIVPYIQKHVIEYAWTPWGKVKIKPAQLGSRAALLGAIPLLTGGLASELSD